jgi:hypothetical protein
VDRKIPDVRTFAEIDVRDGWRPGDVLAVGRLHGTHEPPFYVCVSDQWVCGYMEGVVGTGRAAAAALEKG